MTAEPYRRQLPTTSQGRAGPTGLGMNTATAAPEIDIKITTKSGKSIEVMANYLESDTHFTKRFQALKAKAGGKRMYRSMKNVFIAVSFFSLNIFLFSSNDFQNTTQIAFDKELNNKTNRSMEDPRKKINVTEEKRGYQTEYTNGRFGFTLVYPENLFVTKIVSENGDGITLYNRDRSLELRAYGSWYGENIEQIYHEEQSWIEKSGKKVTYKVLRKSWFILSGIDESKQTIFYLKSYFREGKSLSFRLEYPIADKEKYDSLISTINDNFSIR